jgi:hypothetical protein
MAEIENYSLSWPAQTSKIVPGMSELSSQSNSHTMYEETPMVARRVFRCLDCDQYVVFPSNLPVVASPETINKSDLSHSSFPYDFNALQPPSSDSSNLVQSVFSLSHFPNSPSFFSTDVSLIPFPQVTESSITSQLFDSYDTSSYQYGMETDHSNEVAVLRSEVERLKDVVQTLQQRYTTGPFFPDRIY